MNLINRNVHIEKKVIKISSKIDRKQIDIKMGRKTDTKIINL